MFLQESGADRVQNISNVDEDYQNCGILKIRVNDTVMSFIFRLYILFKYIMRYLWRH